MMKKKRISRLAKVRIIKYTINFGVYFALAVFGVFVGLPEGSPLYTIEQSQMHLTVNRSVIIPVVFCLFGLIATLKDQIAARYKMPKGLGWAIILFAFGFAGWLISYWIMLITGTYLILTLINCLYFNPIIDKELEYRKSAEFDKRKAEEEQK